MRGREFLATRIAHGKIVRPVRTAWWPRHTRNIHGYIQVGDDVSCSLATRARTEAFTAVEGWNRFAPGRALMNEHVGLELALVEGGLSGDTDRIQRVGRLLFNNMREQVRLFGSRIQAFPESTFIGLMSEHITLLGELVHLRREKKSSQDLRECNERCRKNTLALAAFTAEWF